MEDNKILGINKNTFYVIILVLLLIILGIISFHYYGYVVGSPQSGLSAGTGVGVSLFGNPNYNNYLANVVPPPASVPSSAPVSTTA